MTAPATKTPPSPTPRLTLQTREFIDYGRCVALVGDGFWIRAEGDLVDDVPDLGSEEVDHALGSRIVLAVNEHEALVGIAREVRKARCEDCGRDFGKPAPVKCDWCKRVRAILSRIEGGR